MLPALAAFPQFWGWKPQEEEVKEIQQQEEVRCLKLWERKSVVTQTLQPHPVLAFLEGDMRKCIDKIWNELDFWLVKL